MKVSKENSNEIYEPITTLFSHSFLVSVNEPLLLKNNI